VPASTVEKDQP